MATSRKTLTIYWRHAKKYRWHLIALYGLMPLLQLGDDFIVPLLTSKIITRIANLDGPVDLSEFIGPLTLILVLELGINFLWRPYVKILWRFSENVMRDLLKSSFDHLLLMSNQFYNDRFAGSLVSQVNKFAGSFDRLNDAIIWNLLKLAISFVFTVIFLIKPAPLYVLSLSVFSFIYVATLLKVKRTERPYNKRWAAAETKRTGQLADSITNILAVKAFAREDVERELFAREASSVYKHSIETMKKVMHNEMYTTTSKRMINVGAILSSLYLAAQFSIPVGTIYLALVYTLSLMRRLWDLNNTLRAFNRVFGDAHDMTEIFDVEPEVKDPAKPLIFKATRGDIRLKNVDFAYGDQQNERIFEKLSLHIKPGEKVGLVGRSGSGKTTLTKLLLRFMDITGGEILIDKQNIALALQNDVRGAIAYVPQEPLMFHRTIAQNIRYGNLGASDEEVIAVSKLANVHEFVQKLPNGYGTLVGERGTKLSGGQKQRIAIARAMLKNAPILLLDEATSALDSESEELIQDALWKLMQGRTAIVIAHRLSTVQKMDRIIVMDNGRVVEEGSHKELIRRNGVYANLWNRQSGGFLDE